ncbi:lipopolysaccharide-induced tumor necrosis factor-alpha factor homolog [Drosophila grimshawi]|uniref:GH19770 n=1 Tax=Drosophila grimshawi TaxID=7222 RepID=B4J437_DROGR|nr:lipopolysaccharide-induced tumor necrosis factor-alpha factor homolog [Drosophila grimshawi]EDW02643.1 GH19770 [Drosophila grimshawi]
MDQKRAMLYPQVDFNMPSAPLATPTPTPSSEQTATIEAPPSYDVAIAVNTPAAPATIVIAQPQPQPQSAQQPQQQQQQQQQQPLEPTFVQTAPTNLGPNPCRVLCPVCGAQKTTRMTYTPNARTHMAAALICLVGWCVCACFVPYCMRSCRTGNHYCRKCNSFLGVYNPQGVK